MQMMVQWSLKTLMVKDEILRDYIDEDDINIDIVVMKMIETIKTT